jgi:hypothetical protein
MSDSNGAVPTNLHAQRLKRCAGKVAEAQQEWFGELLAGKIVGYVSLTVYTDGKSKIHLLGSFERCESVQDRVDDLIRNAPPS